MQHHLCTTGRTTMRFITRIQDTLEEAAIFGDVDRIGRHVSGTLLIGHLTHAGGKGYAEAHCEAPLLSRMRGPTCKGPRRAREANSGVCSVIQTTLIARKFGTPFSFLFSLRACFPMFEGLQPLN